MRRDPRVDPRKGDVVMLQPHDQHATRVEVVRVARSGPIVMAICRCATCNDDPWDDEWSLDGWRSMTSRATATVIHQSQEAEGRG